jgi:hypothetical protein
VAVHPGDRVYRDALPQNQSAGGVTQVMEADLYREASLLEESPEGAHHEVGVGLCRTLEMDLPRMHLLWNLVTFTNTRGHSCSACCFPKILLCKQPLEAHLSGTVAQDGAES